MLIHSYPYLQFILNSPDTEVREKKRGLRKTQWKFSGTVAIYSNKLYGAAIQTSPTKTLNCVHNLTSYRHHLYISVLKIVYEQKWVQDNKRVDPHTRTRQLIYKVASTAREVKLYCCKGGFTLLRNNSNPSFLLYVISFSGGVCPFTINI